MAAGSSRVKLDLNSPEFQEVFFRLELSELKQVVGSLRRLREFDWNVSETARAVEMPRSNLYKKIERYSLSREHM